MKCARRTEDDNIFAADLPKLKNAPVDRKSRLCHDPGMDLEVARKALSRRSAFSSKRAAFFVIAGLFVVGGIVLRLGHYFTRPEVEQNTPVAVTPSSPPATAPSTPESTESPIQPPFPPAATTDSVPQPPSPPTAAATSPVGPTVTGSQSSGPAQEAATPPNEQKKPTGEAIEEPEQADEAVDHAEQPEIPGSNMILVSRQPIGVLASPSSSAPVLYGFPAGRPFRVIGRSAGFAHIQDLKSSATGWIDEAALAPPPSAPVGSAPSQPKPYSVSRIPPNPWAGPTPNAITADSRAATQPSRKRPGLFGRGGLFGGFFGNGN